MENEKIVDQLNEMFKGLYEQKAKRDENFKNGLIEWFESQNNSHLAQQIRDNGIPKRCLFGTEVNKEIIYVFSDFMSCYSNNNLEPRQILFLWSGYSHDINFNFSGSLMNKEEANIMDSYIERSVLKNPTRNRK